MKPPAPLHIDESGKNSGTNMSDASDHASFASKQIPVLFFFSGLHADYHKPSDTADKIDAVDAAKMLDYVADIATHLADDADRPKFVRVARPPAGPVSGDAVGLPGTGRISGAFRISMSLPRAYASRIFGKAARRRRRD